MHLLIKSLVILGLTAVVNGSAGAEIVIKVDKSTQHMTVLRDGAALYSWPVSTGRTGFATPSGSYTTFRMEADHYSREWDDAPMPHSIFFTKAGHAIHGSYTKTLGMPASHGCVRISPANATTLFNLVKQEGLSNTKVVLSGSEQVALARRGVRESQAHRTDQNAGYYAHPDFNSQEDFQTESAQPLSLDPNRNGEYRGRDFTPPDFARFRPMDMPRYDANEN